MDTLVAKSMADPEFHKKTVDDLFTNFSIEHGKIKRLDDHKVKSATGSYLVEHSLEDNSSTPQI